MKIISSILLICVLICNYAVANDSHVYSVEDCSTNSATISLGGEVHFQRDDPVGKESGPVEASSSSQTLTCGNLDSGSDRDLYFNFKAKPTLGIAGDDGIFKNALTGVGIKYYLVVENFTGFQTCDLEHQDQNYVKSNAYTKVRCHVLTNTQHSSVTVDIKTVLVKIEPSISSGTLTGEPSVIDAQYEINNYPTLFDMPDINIVSTTYVFTDKCSLNNNAMIFDIGDVSASEFSNQIGFTPGQKALQNLNLDCDANVNVNITLNGTKNPDVSDLSVLSLNNQGQNGVADGIGIQFLYNDIPLELNKLLNLKRSAGGRESFPLTARYYQTKTTVKPGTANATATLDITYQ